MPVEGYCIQTICLCLLALKGVTKITKEMIKKTRFYGQHVMT